MSCAEQGAVDGGHARAQQFGDFSGGPVEHVAQQQDGALPRRQVLQGRDECQPDAFPRDDEFRGVVVPGE